MGFGTRRFCAFHKLRHPRELDPLEIEAFLSHLANEQHVSASTQNQALAALLSLYAHVLSASLQRLGELTRAKRPHRVPNVLTPPETAAVLEQMTGVPALMASLLYGAGLRLLECAHLRVEDAGPAARGRRGREVGERVGEWRGRCGDVGF